MQVRSRGLVVLALAMLGAAGVLQFALQTGSHATSSLAEARPGDAVALDGRLSPFQPSVAATGAAIGFWADVRSHLENVTATLDAGTSPWAVVTGLSAPMPGSVTGMPGHVVFTGTVPDGSGRLLVVIRADSAHAPPR